MRFDIDAPIDPAVACPNAGRSGPSRETFRFSSLHWW